MARLRSGAQWTAPAREAETSYTETEHMMTRRIPGTRALESISEKTQVPIRQSKRQPGARANEKEAQQESTGRSEPPQKKRRLRSTRAGHVDIEAVEVEEEEKNGDEDEDSRPSEAFLRSVNEGIRGSVVTTRSGKELRRQSRDAQEQLPSNTNVPRPAAQSGLAESRGGKGQRQSLERAAAVDPKSHDAKRAPEPEPERVPPPREESPSLFVSDREDGEQEDPSDGEGHGEDSADIQRQGQEDQYVEAEDEEDEDGEDEDDDEQAHGRENAQESEPGPEDSPAPPREDIAGYLELRVRATEDREQPFVKVQAAKLAHLEKTVGNVHWTRMKKDCRRCLRKTNESERRWLQRIDYSPGDGGKDLLKALGGLCVLVRKAPRMPDLQGQHAFFLSHADKLEAAITTIRDHANELGNLMESRMSRSQHFVQDTAIGATTTRFIPLMVLIIRETFRLGVAYEDDRDIGHDDLGSFIKPSLGIASYLIGNTVELWESLKAAYNSAGVEHKSLQQLYDQLATFQRNVDNGLRIIAERDPERLKRAKKQDELAKRAAELRRQADTVERNDRMAAFIAGTQRIRQQINSAAAEARRTSNTVVVNLLSDYEDEEEAQARRIDEQLVLERQREEDDFVRQIEVEEQQMEAEATRARQIAWYKEQDRLAQERRESESRARRAKMESRMARFLAATYQMRADPELL